MFGAASIIATIIKRTTKKWFNEKYLIISGDKDFQQLQKYPNVKQYAPIQKQFVGEDIDPKQFLVEQIIWRNHDFKYGPYSATEVTKILKKIFCEPNKTAIFEVMISPDVYDL